MFHDCFCRGKLPTRRIRDTDESRHSRHLASRLTGFADITKTSYVGQQNYVLFSVRIFSGVFCMEGTFEYQCLVENVSYECFCPDFIISVLIKQHFFLLTLRSLFLNLYSDFSCKFRPRHDCVQRSEFAQNSSLHQDSSLDLSQSHFHEDGDLWLLR